MSEGQGPLSLGVLTVMSGEAVVLRVKVQHYNAFTTSIDKGNPAGVVTNADEFDEGQMQEVARLVGFNETTFVLNSEHANLRLRYFTPGHEMNLCGHGTIAAICALVSQGSLGSESPITIETCAGILSVFISSSETGTPEVFMEQATPHFAPFVGSRRELGNAIGIVEDDFHPELPIMYGSTGIWTLLVPVRNLNAFGRMRPDNHSFPSLLREFPRASIHPFCLECYDVSSHMHGRHFSSPYSGTVEDPVTGTASGAMGAYYARYVAGQKSARLNLVVEQGHEIGREGKVLVRISQTDTDMTVVAGGTAVCVRVFEVEIAE